jgi:cytochrome c-type biogenesis protein CcmH/NrfF
VLLAALGAGGIVLATPRPAAAQMGDPALEPPEPTGPEENWLVRNIMCQCGTCRHTLIDCASEPCGHSKADRIWIRQLLDQGRTRDQIINAFITKYGSQIALASPIDRGFNRLAWLLPYSIGAVAAGGLGYAAYRLSRRPAAAGAAAGASADLAAREDSDLADKLDDELRSLD